MNEEIKTIIKEYLKDNLSISISTETGYNQNADTFLITRIDVTIRLNDEVIASDYVNP